MGKLLALGLGMGTVQIACLPYYNKTISLGSLVLWHT